MQLPDLKEWLLNGWQEQLDKWPHDRFVVTCEKYIQREVTVRESASKGWIKQGTAEIFGAVWLNAERLGATFHVARPDHLPTGARLAGIRWSGKSHLRDDLSAESHAAWLCANGIKAGQKHPIG